MVMPASHSSALFHYLCGKHPGKLGWLIGPSALRKTKLRPWVPFALDNDAFNAFTHNTPWDEVAWLSMIRALTPHRPMWALCPDKVADRAATLALWDRYLPVLINHNLVPAFAVQDGMTSSDVPPSAQVVFVGGTTDWKWGTITHWTKHFPRVHVGRVNSVEKLRKCAELGVESVDGTGWFRDPSDPTKLPALQRWLAQPHNPMPRKSNIVTELENRIATTTAERDQLIAQKEALIAEANTIGATIGALNTNLNTLAGLLTVAKTTRIRTRTARPPTPTPTPTEPQS